MVGVNVWPSGQLSPSISIPSTSGVEDTGLFPGADTSIDLAQYLVVDHLEQHETGLGVHDLVGCGVLFLLVESLGLWEMGGGGGGELRG